MIKFLVAFILMAIDIPVMLKKNGRFDILPDFIGFVIVLYGYYKMRVQLRKKGFLKKENFKRYDVIFISTALLFVISYVQCLLNMFGKIEIYNNNGKLIIYVLFYLLQDIIYIMTVFLFVEFLDITWMEEKTFPTVIMKNIIKVQAVLIMLEYLSLFVFEPAYILFFLGQKVAEFIFAFYMIVSNTTYKHVLGTYDK